MKINNDKMLLESLVEKYGKNGVKNAINELKSEVISWRDFTVEFDIVYIDSTLFEVLQKIFENYGIILKYGKETSNMNVTPLFLKPSYDGAAEVLADFTYLYQHEYWGDEGLEEDLAPGIFNFISKNKKYGKKLLKDFYKFWDFIEKLYNAQPYLS